MKQNKKTIKKGEYGYLRSRKRFLMNKTLIFFSISAGIFLLGLLLNQFDKNNIFTIIAAVSVLPAARVLTGLLVLLPYHETEYSIYLRIKKLVRDNEILYTDLVFTSSEHVMNLSFLLLTEREVLGVLGKNKVNLHQIQQFLSVQLRKQGYEETVKIFETYQELENCVTNTKRSSDDQKVQNDSIHDLECIFLTDINLDQDEKQDRIIAQEISETQDRIEAQEISETQGTIEVQEISETQGTIEAQEISETQDTFEIQESIQARNRRDVDSVLIKESGNLGKKQLCEYLNSLIVS